jgi:hypothetical protein
MLLPTEVEWALAKLLQQEISNYRYLSPIKAQLVNALDYTSLEAFKSLDLFNLGFITIDRYLIFLTEVWTFSLELKATHLELTNCNHSSELST